MPSPLDAVERLFHQAAALVDPQERKGFLDRECGDDSDLRRDVERMLAAHSGMGSFLEAPALTRNFDAAAGAAAGPGSVLGPYKLLQQIGEGGMGVVFMAEQHAPVRRKVALKLIKPGFDSGRVLARFAAERQALALMDHPNIAKALDAGESAAGRPYFVMELIHGVPITQYCDARKLSLERRLELFQTVCHAVQHAHQKGVIHRDLKPSNVLVCDYDDRPAPKIIDFGVAKAIGQQLTEKTLFTEFGLVIGTLEYMSPEQAKLNQLDVDTRTDVYALGVLLYELMTGVTPLDRERLQRAAFDEVLRTIRDEEPPRPSARLSTTKRLPEIAASRSLSPPDLMRAIRGDLDWIAMKALHKNRNARYETASGLAADVARFYRHEPVTARPPSARYQLAKFFRRHRAAVAATTAMLCGLLVAIGGIAAGAGWAVRDRAAREEQARHEQVAQQRRSASQLEAAFGQVRELKAARRFDEAWAAMQSAEAIVKTANVTGEQLAEYEAEKSTLSFIRQLVNISSRSDALLGEKVTLQPHYAELDASYRSIFARAGIDFEQSPQAAIAAIESMDAADRVEAIAAIDDWLAIRSLRQQGDPTPLAAALDAIDADAWRRELRSAIARLDRPSLEQFALSEEIAHQSLSLAASLALALRELNIDAERDFLRRLVDLHPGNYYLKCRLAESLLLLADGKSDVEEGLGLASTLHCMHPESGFPLWLLAHGHLTLGQDGRAESYVGKLLKANPDNCGAEFLAARMLYHRGSFGAGLARLQRAIDLARDKDPAACRAYCYELAVQLTFVPHSEVRDPQRALALALSAHDLAPGHAKSLTTLAAVSYGLEDWPHVLEYGLKAAAADAAATPEQRIEEAYDHPAVVPLLLAAANWHAGEAEQARQCYEQGQALLRAGHPGFLLPEALQIEVERLMSRDLTIPSWEHAARGQWDLAIRSFDYEVHKTPADSLARVRLITLLKFVEDARPCRDQCRALLKLLEATDDPLAAERAARVCLLPPSAAEDLAQVQPLLAVVERAEALPDWFDEWFALTKGLAELRGG